MVCLGSVRAGGNQGEGESEEVKWGSLMMTRLDIPRQTVSSCLPCELCLTHTCGSYTLHSHTRSRGEPHAQGHPLPHCSGITCSLRSYVTRAIDPSDPLQTLEVVLGIQAPMYTHRRQLNPQSSSL